MKLSIEGRVWPYCAPGAAAESCLQFVEVTVDAGPFIRRSGISGRYTATVTYYGRIWFRKRKVNSSQVFAGQTVGVKEVNERVWLVRFMNYDHGYFDDETCRVEPIENFLGPKVLPVSANELSHM